MPDRPRRDVRPIPNFNMTEPWSAPLSPENADIIAQSALLSGAGESETQIQAILSDFPRQYIQNLRGARG